jgi:hypothetical protein
MARSTGLVSGDDGWRIPDWLWERLAPLIPPPPVHPLGCSGASARSDRDECDPDGAANGDAVERA